MNLLRPSGLSPLTGHVGNLMRSAESSSAARHLQNLWNRIGLAFLFSSPEPKAHWWAYRIGRPLSSVVRRLSVRPSIRRPHSLNIFSSETTGPIKAKFHMESPWDRGTKVCSKGPGHMTKMAAMPIYGKNLKKSSSLEPNIQTNLLSYRS